MRGKDRLYSYLLAFYQDDKVPTGWNNLVFHGVAMPYVLWNCRARSRSSRPNTRTSKAEPR